MKNDKPATQLIQMNSGKRIAYCEYGDPNGKPVLFFHGTPGSRYDPAHCQQAALKYGYRIIAPDRPGIGRSDYVPRRNLLDWPQTGLEIGEQLGFKQFGVIGVSGGSAYALAYAFAIPEKLDFIVTMGSLGASGGRAPIMEHDGASGQVLWQALEKYALVVLLTVFYLGVCSKVVIATAIHPVPGEFTGCG